MQLLLFPNRTTLHLIVWHVCLFIVVISFCHIYVLFFFCLFAYATRTRVSRKM